MHWTALHLIRYVSLALITDSYKSCMSDVEKFDQTLLDYFAMLLLYLMVKMVELKKLCFVMQMPEWRAHLFEELYLWKCQ